MAFQDEKSAPMQSGRPHALRDDGTASNGFLRAPAQTWRRVAGVMGVAAGAIGLLGTLWLPPGSAVLVGVFAAGAVACACAVRLRVPPLKRARTPLPNVWYTLARHGLTVIGTEHYQNELREIRAGAGAVDLVATLVPERTGERHRVRVDLASYTVGYLSDAAAETYRARLGSDAAAVSVHLSGQDPVTITIA